MKEAFKSYGVALGLVVVTTVMAVPLRTTLTLANFTMIYLLLVLILAIQRGIIPSLVTAFASFLSINFFLVPPYYTFIVADPREVLDLVVFLVVGVVAGRLAAKAREQAQEAQQRAHDQEVLYRLADSFNQFGTRSGVTDSLLQVVQREVRALRVQVLPADEKAPLVEGVAHYTLLQTGADIYGTLMVVCAEALPASRLQLVNACARQAAQAIQRAELAEKARLSQQFEEADRLKTAILHAASHDLRTPITIIKSSASNLRQLGRQLGPEEEAEIAQTIENEADELNKLVGNLLDMSRLKAGTLTLNAELNSLEEVVGDVVARVYQISHQERVMTTFPDDMPLVCFDYGLILQAVTNLVDNTLRYEPADSKVEVRGEFDVRQARLKIINHGETIPPEVKARMMEPFFHGAGGRTGLGMPIAKGIIEAHGGQLWVEDTIGHGATFVIALPIMEAHGHEAQNSGG